MDWPAIVLSAQLALATLLVLLPLAIGVARWLAVTSIRGKAWVEGLLALPLVLPPTVLGYYLIVVIGRNGALGQWLEDRLGISLIFTWQGAVVAAAVVSFPLILKAARAAFEGVDRNLENAARTLGQREAAVLLRVTLPLAWRGILAGTLLALARAMGEFGATLMVAGNIPGRTQTLSLAVYDAVQAGNDALAGTLVLITSVTCVALLVGSGRLLRVRHA